MNWQGNYSKICILMDEARAFALLLSPPYIHKFLLHVSVIHLYRGARTHTHTDVLLSRGSTFSSIIHPCTLCLVVARWLHGLMCKVIYAVFCPGDGDCRFVRNAGAICRTTCYDTSEDHSFCLICYLLRVWQGAQYRIYMTLILVDKLYNHSFVIYC